VVDQPRLELVGGYPDVESFTAIQNEPCHVIVLDLCLNRRTGDAALSCRASSGLSNRVAGMTITRPRSLGRQDWLP
jgi:hypothetical protein